MDLIWIKPFTAPVNADSTQSITKYCNLSPTEDVTFSLHQYLPLLDKHKLNVLMILFNSEKVLDNQFSKFYRSEMYTTF
jgi:hypothetical protein